MEWSFNEHNNFRQTKKVSTMAHFFLIQIFIDTMNKIFLSYPLLRLSGGDHLHRVRDRDQVLLESLHVLRRFLRQKLNLDQQAGGCHR